MKAAYLHTRLNDYTIQVIIAYTIRQLWAVGPFDILTNIFSQSLGLSKNLFRRTEMDVKTNLNVVGHLHPSSHRIRQKRI